MVWLVSSLVDELERILRDCFRFVLCLFQHVMVDLNGIVVVVVVTREGEKR
jgi:hypothetical protein